MFPYFSKSFKRKSKTTLSYIPPPASSTRKKVLEKYGNIGNKLPTDCASATYERSKWKQFGNRNGNNGPPIRQTSHQHSPSPAPAAKESATVSQDTHRSALSLWQWPGGGVVCDLVGNKLGTFRSEASEGDPTEPMDDREPLVQPSTTLDLAGNVSSAVATTK